MSHRGKIHETCRYWKESKCMKGEYQCSFIHGYVCGNDGRCWRDNCNRIHFNQKKPLHPRDFHPNKQNFPKQGYRPRERRSHSGSPDWYHKSLPRGRSPVRRRSRSRSRTPLHHLVRGCSPPRRHTSRSLSPRRFSRSRSPSRRQIVSRERPWRRSRSRSRGRSVTPYRSRSRSPRARSRSPSIPPTQIRSRSSSSSRPRIRSRSASRSYSRARSRSSSRLYPPPRSTSISPIRKQTRSGSRSQTRSPSRPGSRGGRRSRPQSRSGSTARSLAGKRHSSYSSRSRSSSPERNRKTSRSPARQAKASTVASKKIIDLEDLYADIDSEEPSQTADQLSHNDVAAVSKIQAQLSKTFFDPETKKLIEEALKSTRENQSKKEREEQNSEDENEDKLGLDLEEVGEEVDDIFAKSMTRCVDDSGENTFQANIQGKRQKEMEAGSNPSPPKPQPGSKSAIQPLRTLDLGFHTDWELKSALDNPSQALEKEIKMPMGPPPIVAVGGRGKPSSSSLWTPALDRRMVQEAKIKTQMAYQDKGSNWEVETPYVGRKEKCELKDVVSTKPIHRSTERRSEEESTSVKENTLFPSAMSHPLHASSSASGFGSADHPNSIDFRSKEKERLPSRSPEPVSRLSRKIPEDHSPRASSESPRRHQKEKKKKRKKESSNSDSASSDGEERRDEQRKSQEKEELRRGIDTLLTRKESLTKRVKLLLEQRNMMNDQRHDIMKNHKGSRATLTNLLDENSFLIKEIGKQISNINNMIEKVEEDIDVKQEVLRKVSKPVFSDKPDSPYQSKERQRKLLYSPEREKYRKASYYNQVNEEKSSPVREDRSRPGYRKESSPLAAYNKQYRFTEGPNEPTNKRLRMLLQEDEKWSRSPSGQRLPPSASKEGGGRHLAPSPDSRGSTSPPSKVRVAVKGEKERLKDSEEGRGQYTSKVSQKSYNRHMEQEGGRKETETEPSASMLYAPHESQRTFMRYMDQGMHWCKLCATFCETAPEYIDHLMSQSHLDRVKNDRKSWLAKAPREEKEQRPPNAQVITVPLQGLEFIHSLPSYYCSLCDAFMRDKGEAVRHPESKLHVSNYKVHRAKNPLLETTFLKAKTAAYAKYKIDEERKLMEDQIKAKDKTKMEIESKLLRQMHEKLDRRDDRREDRKDDRAEGKAREKNEVCGSIRVASRGQRQRKTYHKSAPSEKKDYRDTKEEEKSPRDLKQEASPPRNSNEAKKLDRAKDKEDKSEPSKESPVPESKCEESTREDNSDLKKKEEDKKSSTTKLPLIGKMPFLKKRPSLMKKKEQEQKKSDVAKVVTEQKASKLQDKGNSIDGNANPLPVIENKGGNNEEKERNSTNACVEQTSDKMNPEKEESRVGNVETFEGERYVVMTFSSHDEDSSDSDIMDISETYLVDEEVDEPHGAAEETIQALDLLNIPLPGFEPSPHDQKSISEELPPLVETVPKSGEEWSAFQLSGSENTMEVSTNKDLVVLPSSAKSIEHIPLPPGTEEEVSKPKCSFEPIPPGTGASLKCPVDVDTNTPPYSSYVTTSESYVDGATQERSCAEPAVFSAWEGSRIMPLPRGKDNESHVIVSFSNSPHSSNVTGDFIDVPVPQFHSSESYGSDNNSSDITPAQQDGAINKYFVIDDPKPIPVLGAVQYNWMPPPVRRVEREPTPPPPGTETYISHPKFDVKPTVREELTRHERQGKNLPFSKDVCKGKGKAPQSSGSQTRTEKIPNLLSSEGAPTKSDNTDQAEPTIGGQSTKKITSKVSRTLDVQPSSSVKEIAKDKSRNDPVRVSCSSEEKVEEKEESKVESTSDKEERTNANSASNTKSGKEEDGAVEVSSCLESKQEEKTSNLSSKSDEGEYSVARIDNRKSVGNEEEESTAEGKNIMLIIEEEEDNRPKESCIKSVCGKEVEKENEEVYCILNETEEKDETKDTSEDTAEVSEDIAEISEDKLEVSEEPHCVESETGENTETPKIVTDEVQGGIEETVSIQSVSEEKEDKTEEHCNIIEDKAEEPDNIESFTEKERNITDSASCMEFMIEDESNRNKVPSSTESEEERDNVEARSSVEFDVEEDREEVGSEISVNKEEEESIGEECGSVKSIPEKEKKSIDSPAENIEYKTTENLEYKTEESNNKNSVNEETKDISKHEPQFDDDESDDDKSMGESLKTSLQEICQAVDDLIDSPTESTLVNTVKSPGAEQEEPPQGLFATQCLLPPGTSDDATEISSLSKEMAFGVGNSSSVLKTDDEARRETVMDTEKESKEVIRECSPESKWETRLSSSSDSGVAPQRTDNSDGERGKIYLQDSQLHSISTECHMTASTTNVQNINQESRTDQLSPQSCEKNLLGSSQEEEDLLSTQIGMCDVVPSAGICDIGATLDETGMNLDDVITDDTESHTSKPGSCSDEVSTGNIEDCLEDEKPPKRVTRPTGKRTQRGRKRLRRSSRSSTVKEVEEVDFDDIPEEVKETKVLSSEDLSRDSLTQSSDTADMTSCIEETQPVTKQTARSKRAAARQRAEEEENFVSSRKRSRSSSSSSRQTSAQAASVQEPARPIRSSRRAAVAASAAMSAMARSSDLSPTSSPPIEKDKDEDSMSGEESESE